MTSQCSDINPWRAAACHSPASAPQQGGEGGCGVSASEHGNSMVTGPLHAQQQPPIWGLGARIWRVRLHGDSAVICCAL